MCTLEVDSSSSESSSISGSEYSDSEASIDGEHINKRVYESVGEIRPSRFQPSGRTSTEREIQKRIMGPRAAAASIKKARLVSAFTLVNKVSEN